jgi:hypothetical protein
MDQVPLRGGPAYARLDMPGRLLKAHIASINHASKKWMKAFSIKTLPNLQLLSGVMMLI